MPLISVGVLFRQVTIFSYEGRSKIEQMSLFVLLQALKFSII